MVAICLAVLFYISCTTSVQCTIPLRFPLNWFRERAGAAPVANATGQSSNGTDAILGLGGASQLLASVAQDPQKAAQDIETLTAMKEPALELRNKSDGSGEIVVIDEANLPSGAGSAEDEVTGTPVPPQSPQGLSAFLAFFRPWLFGSSTTTPQPSTTPVTETTPFRTYTSVLRTTTTEPQLNEKFSQTTVEESTASDASTTPSPVFTNIFYRTTTGAQQEQPGVKSFFVAEPTPVGSTLSDVPTAPVAFTFVPRATTDSDMDEKSARTDTFQPLNDTAVSDAAVAGTTQDFTVVSDAVTTHDGVVEAKTAQDSTTSAASTATSVAEESKTSPKIFTSALWSTTTISSVGTEPLVSVTTERAFTYPSRTRTLSTSSAADVESSSVTVETLAAVESRAASASTSTVADTTTSPIAMHSTVQPTRSLPSTIATSDSTDTTGSSSGIATTAVDSSSTDSALEREIVTASSTESPSTTSAPTTVAREGRSSMSPVYRYYFDPSQLMQESP
ncbi:uncharacterized protein LOC135393545 isoform X2 [Ornithodoros turicata]